MFRIMDQKIITISDMQELAKRKNGKRSTWELGRGQTGKFKGWISFCLGEGFLHSLQEHQFSFHGY
jgi:hypothetical protein